jgi:hypothetical protein
LNATIYNNRESKCCFVLCFRFFVSMVLISLDQICERSVDEIDDLLPTARERWKEPFRAALRLFYVHFVPESFLTKIQRIIFFLSVDINDSDARFCTKYCEPDP